MAPVAYRLWQQFLRFDPVCVHRNRLYRVGASCLERIRRALWDSHADRILRAGNVAIPAGEGEPCPLPPAKTAGGVVGE
jgi:hypothetical protein